MPCFTAVTVILQNLSKTLTGSFCELTFSIQAGEKKEKTLAAFTQVVNVSHADIWLNSYSWFGEISATSLQKRVTFLSGSHLI